MSKETYSPWDSAEFLDNDEVVIEYLKAALEENDPEFFVKALGNVARANGMTLIGAKTKLARQSLYKALSGKRDPRIGTVMKVLGALGVQLSVTPKIRRGPNVTMSHSGGKGDILVAHRRGDF